MRKPSLLQTKRECFVTGRTDQLEVHHCFSGTSNRQVSDEQGFWVYLTTDWHRHNKWAVHKNPNSGIDLMLKQTAQRLYEREHSREEFVKLIGKSYL